MPTLQQLYSDSQIVSPNPSVGYTVLYYSDKNGKIVAKAKKSDGTVTTISGGLHWIGSLLLYAAIAVKDPDTVYFIEGSDSILWAKILHKPTTISGYNITDLKLLGKKLTVGSNSIIIGSGSFSNSVILWNVIKNTPSTLLGYGIIDAYTKNLISDALLLKADKATTLSGYGITDAYIDDNVVYLGNNSVRIIKQWFGTREQYDAIEVKDPYTIYNIYKLSDSSSVTSVLWSQIGNKPTTINGYNITDAYINGNTIKLGSNSITVGSATSVDWSQVNNKPTTINGYNITDAYINLNIVTLGSNSLTVLPLWNRSLILSSTVAQDKDFLIVKANCTITLPACVAGMRIHVGTSGTANNVLIVPSAGDVINLSGSSTADGLRLDRANVWVLLFGTANGWDIAQMAGGIANPVSIVGQTIIVGSNSLTVPKTVVTTALPLNPDPGTLYFIY